jgi:putative flippase GtrA
MGLVFAPLRPVGRVDTQRTSKQFIRYIGVAGLAALFDTACLYSLNRFFGVRPWIAGAFGFLVGLTANYRLSRAWVFESTGRPRQEFTLFALIGIGGLLWTELILWFTITLAHVSLLFSKATALVLVLVWNFGMRKRFVFGKHGEG